MTMFPLLNLRHDRQVPGVQANHIAKGNLVNNTSTRTYCTFHASYIEVAVVLYSSSPQASLSNRVSSGFISWAVRKIQAVSYTHLTLPTILLV